MSWRSGLLKNETARDPLAVKRRMTPTSMHKRLPARTVFGMTHQ